jgi:hypothetical protein
MERVTISINGKTVTINRTAAAGPHPKNQKVLPEGCPATGRARPSPATRHNIFSDCYNNMKELQ